MLRQNIRINLEKYGLNSFKTFFVIVSFVYYSFEFWFRFFKFAHKANNFLNTRKV